MNNNLNILATVGLNPVPVDSSGNLQYILTQTQDDKNIACYGTFKISFVPPFTQYSFANFAITNASSLTKISGTKLYEGRTFKDTVQSGNQIIMAPLQVTAKYVSSLDSLSITFAYPADNSTTIPGYQPFPNVVLSESVLTTPDNASLSFITYPFTQLNTDFYFPTINNVAGPPRSVSIINTNIFKSDYKNYFSLYSVLTDASGGYSFTSISLNDIKKSTATQTYPFIMVIISNNIKNLFLYTPGILNQTTIPKKYFDTFLNQVYTGMGASYPGYRILGVLYFDNFSLNNTQSVQCVFGDIIYNATSTDVPPASCNGVSC
jgi:hypothetical protein